MDFTWLPLLAPVLPLVGVLIGANIASRSADRKWLREARLEAYTLLIEKLMDINKVFGVELKNARFPSQGGVADISDSDVDLMTAWLNKMVELDILEMKVRILGGKLSRLYQQQIYDQINKLHLAVAGEREATEEEWEELGVRSQYLAYQLEFLARSDLAVAKIDGGRRFRPFIKKAPPMSYEQWKKVDD